MTATTGDLALLLDVTDLNTTRATFLLAKATELCESIVNPLPDGSDGVVLDVAARAYSNPTSQQFQAPGPYQPGGVPNMGGLWLTKANIAMLRRLSASNAGAFTIDPTPDDAGPSNYWGQIPLDPSQPWANPPYYGDWDVPPSG